MEGHGSQGRAEECRGYMKSKDEGFGNCFNCHHGYFELPDKIISVHINKDMLRLNCEGGKTFLYSKEKNYFVLELDGSV